MMIDAYIGHFNSPGFDFYCGNYDGNIPKRQSPLLPMARGILDAMCKMMRNAEYEARQLDWGAWGAKMTKEQLSDFINSFYGNDEFDELPEVRDYIQKLDADKVYLLVAYETGEDYGD